MALVVCVVRLMASLTMVLFDPANKIEWPSRGVPRDRVALRILPVLQGCFDAPLSVSS